MGNTPVAKMAGQPFIS